MTKQQISDNGQLRPKVKSKKSPKAYHSRWQFLVISGANASSPTTHNVRLDLARSSNAPHLPLGWIQQVGWHNAQAASPLGSYAGHPTTLNSQACQSGTIPGAVVSPKFLIAGTPHPTFRETHLTGSSEIEKRLLELAQQLADNIKVPLESSHQIITKLHDQIQFNSYLSMDDVQQLAAVSRNLELLSQWTESILLRCKIDAGGLQVVRSRFAPEQWRDSLEGILQAIASPKDIRIDWIGWDTQLPLLYLDSNHLTRAVIRLVANAVAASEPGGVVNIRASWQHNVTGRLMITIEDSGMKLPAALMKVLNSAAMDSILPTEGNGLHVARQLISAIGGLIAAQHGPHSGTIVRISLPVDNYASVIRAWILQNATTLVSSEPYRIGLFAIRSSQTASDLFNEHLQKSASARQFVYRVANHRWLVLELKSSHERSDSTLMATVAKKVPVRLQASQPWLSQSVFVSQLFALDGLLGRTDSDLRLPQLTDQLVAKFEELLADNATAINQLTIGDPLIPAPHFNRPSQTSVDSASQSNRPDMGEAEPGFQTASEIVKQWKLVQAKLATLNSQSALSR